MPDVPLPDAPEACALCPLLCTEDYARAADDLHLLLAGDERGLKILSVMLRAALITREKYRVKGIPDEIFCATMGFFGRSVREYKETYGFYGFDRWWWGGRQLSLKLFRLGELEFELSADPAGRRAVAVHIPGDSDLSAGAVDASFTLARSFLREHFPEYEGCGFSCRSWMLSPALEQLLDDTSRIVRFRRRFRILDTDEADESYKQWVFKDARLSPECFPEHTTLQKNMKKFVLEGGKVGTATGIMTY